MMTKKLLITGFEPFGEDKENSSWEAVVKLPDRIGDWVVTKLRIPVVFGQAAETVQHKAQELRVDSIICVGQATGRCQVTLEQVGINLRNGMDSNGNNYQDAFIVAGAPTAYFATLPIRTMLEAIKAIDIPATISYTAGTYVCNDTLYTLLHHYIGTSVKVGFIHLPCLPGQAVGNTPSLPCEVLTKALQAAVQAMQ